MTKPGGSITPRYATLPLVALLLRVLGYLFMAYTGLKMALILFSSREAMEDLPTRFGRIVDCLFYGLVIGVLLIAVSECIHVLMDIESHTRRAADAATGTVTGTTPRRGAGDKQE